MSDTDSNDLAEATTFKYDLVDIYDEKEAEKVGGFKTTRKLSADSNLLYYSGKRSSFNLSVQRLASINGWSNVADASRKAMTLIILSFNLHSTKATHSFESIITHMSFESDGVDSDGVKASPEIVNFAPFKQGIRTNETTEQQSRGYNVSGQLGASVIVSATASAGYNSSVEKTQVFFAKAKGSISFSPDDDTPNGVKWSMWGNQSQHTGTENDFENFGRVALLIERKSAAPWVGYFTIEVDAGWQEGIVGGFRRLCGIDPSKTRLPFKATEKPVLQGHEGQAIAARVEANMLGEYLRDDALLKLL